MSQRPEVDEHEAVEELQELDIHSLSEEEFDALDEDALFGDDDDSDDVDIESDDEDAIGDDQGSEEDSDAEGDQGTEAVSDTDLDEEEGVKGDDVDSDESDSDPEPLDFNSILSKPIKANGSEVTVTPDEAVRLIQQGLGFNKNMAKLSTARKTQATLDKHNITTDQLNLLIDVSKGNKDALKQIIKQHELSVSDLDDSYEEGTSNYVAPDYGVSNAAIELNDVVARLSPSPHYGRLTDTIVSMDAGSKDMINKNPLYLDALHAQIAGGVYDVVNQEIEKQIALGNLSTSVPYFQHYLNVGQAMTDAGRFESRQQRPPAATTNQPASVPKVKRDQASALQKSKKLAAKAPASAPPASNGLGDIDIWKLSDEEFDKLDESLF